MASIQDNIFVLVLQGDKVVEYLRGIFENEESRAVQAVLCSGLSKLMLSGMVTDEKVYIRSRTLRLAVTRLLQVIKTLIIAYVSPDNADNQHVRQCLSYFFPVYCYSSSENQRRIQAVRCQPFEVATGLTVT